MARSIATLSGGSPLLGHLREFRDNRLGFLLRAQRECGDVCLFRLGPLKSILVMSPELVGPILVEHAYDFEKSVFYHYMQRLLGRGLVTSEGDFHKRQRKLVAPLLQPRRIASYAQAMSDFGERVQAEWVDRSEVDVQHEMMRITLGIVGKTLFGTDVLGEASELGPALDVANHWVGTELNHLIHWPMWLPFPRLVRARRAIRRLDETIYRLIAERRKTGDQGDILSMLLAAQEEGGSSGLTDEQVRDEAMTMFAAGHETTATALTWAFFLLAQNSAAYARLREEADRVLAGRPATLEDLPKLPWAMQVFKETLRLFPPAYGVGRLPMKDIEIDGYFFPEGMNVFVSIYAMQRRADLFPHPEEFDPERFSAENEKTLPKHAYLPFATGPRVCIGNHFAMMEGQLLLATLAQRVELKLAQTDVVPAALITLRARDGIRMRVKRRQPRRVAA